MLAGSPLGPGNRPLPGAVASVLALAVTAMAGPVSAGVPSAGVPSTGPVFADARSAGTDGPTWPPAVHTELEATFPAADSLHRGDVGEVRLRYTTAVQLRLSTVRVRGSDGEVIPSTGPDTVPGTGSAEIRVRFDEALPSGAYTVEWRTAGPDDHPIEGQYGFEVERPEREPAAEDTAGGPLTPREPAAGVQDDVPMAPTGADASGAAGPGPVGVAVRWLFFASVVGMLGASVFRFTVVPVLSREEGWEEAARVGRDRLFRLAFAAAVLGAVALPARLGVQAATFFGADGVTASAAWSLLSTAWGAGWIVQAVALVIFGGGLALVRRRPRGGWLLMLLGAALATVAPALSGHARAVDPALRSLATVVDALHVAAAGIWLGGLGALVLVGVGAASRATGDAAGSALPRVVNAFSRVALIAVAGLFATGLVQAWLHLGSVQALWGSVFGRTLAVKLGLVAVVAALGFYNWRVVRPALRDTPRPALIRGPATVELAVGIAILLVTAILVASPLPGG